MKSRSSGYSSDSEQQNMQQDLSVLRKPICTALSGFLEAKRAYENGTEEIKRLLSRECDIIYECNICRNMFRSLTNFISHKRVYCRNSFNTLSHNLNPNRNGYIDHDISTIIQTEINNGNKSTNTNKDNSNKSGEGSTKDLSSIVEKLIKREQENRVLKLTDLYDQVNFQLKQDEILRKKHVLQLDKVPNSNAAVYQTIKNNENDNIKNEINEVAQLLENNKNIIGPDGKLITENHNSISNGTTNEKDCTTNNETDNDTKNISGEFSCNLCNRKYSTEKTLRLHIQRNHIPSTYVYQCPSCLLPFSQPGAVMRHLSNDHKKSARRVRAMRESIFKRKVRISDVQKKAPSKELSRLQSRIDNSDLSNITNGGENQLWNKNNEWSNINTPICSYCGKKFERRAVLTTHLTNCPMKIRTTATTTQSATSVSTTTTSTRKSNEIRNIQKILENGSTTTVISNDNETNIRKSQDKKSILGHSIFIDSIDLTNDDCIVPPAVVVSKRKRKKTLKISKESDSNDIDSEKLNEMFLKLGCSDNSITLKSMPFDSNSNNNKNDKCNDNAFNTPITIDEDEQPKDNVRKICSKTDKKELLNRQERKSETKLELLDGALNRKSISSTLREDLEKLENSKEITITQLEKQLTTTTTTTSTTSTKISKDGQKIQQRLQQQQEQEQQKQLQKQQKEQLKQQKEQQKQQKQQQEQQKQQQEPQKQKQQQEEQQQQQQPEKNDDVDDESMIQSNESNLNPKQNVSFLCRICEKQFDVISNVRRHISMFHYRSRKFGCKVCHDFKAYRKFDVLNHLSTIHSMDEEKEVAMKYVEISGNKNKIEGIEDDIVVVDNKLSFNNDISMEISVSSEKRIKKRVRRQKLSKVNNTIEQNSDELKDEQTLPQKEQEKLPIKIKFTRSSINNLLSTSNDESSLKIIPPSSKRPIRNRIKPVHKDFVYDLSHILKKDMISENVPARAANKRRHTLTTHGDRDEILPNKIANGTVVQQLTPSPPPPQQQQQQPQQQQQQSPQQQQQQQSDLKIKGSAEKMAKLAVASYQASYFQMPDFPERQFFPLRVFSPLIAPNFDFSTPKTNSNETTIIKEYISDKIIEDIIPKHRRMSDDNIVHILSKRKRLNSTLGKNTKSTSSSHIDEDINFFNENNDNNSSIKCPTEKEFKEHLLLNKLSEPVKKLPVTSFVEPKKISSSSSSSSTPSKRITLLQRLAENQHKKIQESLLRSVLEK